MPADTSTSSPPAPASLPIAALLPIVAVVFINFAGFSLILPLLPFYGHELAASPTQVALLFAAYSFGGIFGEIYWGRSSDRRGRKRILILATAFAAVSYVAFAYVTTFWLALAIRVVTGFFSGTVGVCQSYIADVTKPEQRARSIGYLGAAINLGFVIGPAIGGLLAAPERGLPGFRAPILVSAAIAGLAALWCAFVLRESHAPGAARPLPKWGEAFGMVSANPLLARLFAIAFVGIGAFASMEAVFGLWTERNFRWTTHQVGLTFIAVGATGFLVQILLIGRATKRFGEARVIVTGLAVLASSMLLQPVIREPIAAVALMSLLMAGHSIAFPSTGAQISRSTNPQLQGSINGLLMASNALARILLPPLIGLIYTAGPDLPYYVCAGIVGLALLLGLQVVTLRDNETRAPKAAAT
jgi:MFS family permease